ncbi:hypothetical protein ACIOEZ_34140 [Streptomyces sp. NPDC087866]|uniref:hypothetical protein n=1 Tax=Streptomyces sp. NPDC087866 TaxID=3365815 RepID=UPI00380426C8
MTVYPIAVAVAAVVGACAIWWRLHRLQQATRRFRAAVRLTEAAHHRDMVAFRARVAAAIADQEAAAHLLDEVAVLDAAEDIVNAELARTTRHNPQEGDTP